MNVEKITDAAFVKQKEAKKSGKKSEGEFFAQADKKVRSRLPNLFSISFLQKALPAEFIAEQKAVDAAIMGKMKKDGILVRYLRARFTLSNGVLPHELKF